MDASQLDTPQGTQADLLQYLHGLCSLNASPEQFEQRTSAVVHKLGWSVAKELDPVLAPQLLNAMASAVHSATNISQQQDSSSILQASISLLVGVASWLVQETQHLSSLDPQSLCQPLTDMMDKVLLLSQSALFDCRWYQLLGSHTYQACSSAVRNAIKDIGAFTHTLLSIWADVDEAGDVTKVEDHLMLCKVLADVVTKRLLDLGIAAAEAVLSQGSTVPKEMASLASVNALWGALIKLLTALPATSQLSIIGATLAVQVMDLNLNYLSQWLQHFTSFPYDGNKLKVVRFWMGQLTKVVGTYVSCAAVCWDKLVAVTLSVYAHITESASSEHAAQLHYDLQYHLAPKLVQLIMICLEEEMAAGDQQEPGLSLDSITGKSDVEVHVPEEEQSKRLLLAVALMHRSSLLSVGTSLLAMTRQLLPWALRTAAVDMYAVSAQQDFAEGSPFTLVSSAAVALVSACSAFACSLNDAAATTAWKECLKKLHASGCSAHPAERHLACMTISALVAASSAEVAQQHLLQLAALVSDLAAAEAMTECGAWLPDNPEGRHSQQPSAILLASAGESLACRAAELLATALQAARESAASAVFQQLQLEARHCDASTGNLASAVSTSLLLGSFASAGCCLAAMEAVPWLGQLPSRIDQLQEILQHPKPQPEEFAVAMVYLSALLMAMDVNIKLSQQLVQEGMEGADAAGVAVGQAAAVAAELLRTWALQQAAAPPAFIPPHIVWALRVVARAGPNMSTITLATTLPALMILADHSMCTPHVAAAAAHLAGVEPLPVVLFHNLLRKPEWVLQHEALLSLVSVSRMCTATDFRTMIPQDLFVPANDSRSSVQPAVFKLGKAYKAYLEHQPSLDLSGDVSQLQADGRAVQGLSDDGREQCHTLCKDPDVAGRLRSGATALAGCTVGAEGPALPVAQQQQQQVPPLVQLLQDGKLQVAAVVQTLGVLETSLRSLQQTVVSGDAMAMATTPQEARAQVTSHASHMLGELASASSKLRALQEVLQSCTRPGLGSSW